MDNVKHFESIVSQMAETYARKNTDYGNSFDKTLDKWGYKIALARIEDKLNRVDQLFESGEAKVKDESVEDTLKDLATYAVMFLMWYQNSTTKEEPMLKSVQFEPTQGVKDFLQGFQPPEKSKPWTEEKVKDKLQKYLNCNMEVRKGLNNTGWNPTYLLGRGTLSSFEVKDGKVYAHFDNITKGGKRVGSGTADVIYPIEALGSFGFNL